MPIWLQIVVSVVGLLATIGTFCGFGAYLSERAKHKADKKNKEEDEIEAMKHEAYRKELTDIINQALIPLNTKVDKIGEDLELVKRGVQVTCRNDLEDLYDIAEKRGYCSNEDKKRFEATYKAYHGLGKNGVMDGKYDNIIHMPESKPSRPRKARTKKKILNESN